LTALSLLAVVLLVGLVSAWHQGPDEGASPADDVPTKEPVIAVLPLEWRGPENRAGGQASGPEAYLAEGLAEEILSALANHEGVDVIAANSSFRFGRLPAVDRERLARELGITHIVEGSVRQVTEELRITVHLVDLQSGLTTWSEVFQSESHAIFTLPDAVASSVVRVLGGPAGPNTLAARHAPDPQAYRHYLQGQAMLREGTAAALQRSIDLFEEATRLDANFGDAWAALALARLYVAMVQPGATATGFRNRDPVKRLAAARAEAEQALRVDPDLVHARLALTIIDYRARLIPLAQAESRFLALAEQAPGHAEVLMRAGMMLLELGLYDASIPLFERATRLDPLSLQANCFLLQALQQAGRRSAAETLLAELPVPGYGGTFIRLEQLLETRDYDRARAWLASAARHQAFGPHGVLGEQRGINLSDEPLYRLLDRLIDAAEGGVLDPELAQAWIEAANRGDVLHYYAVVLLAAAGYRDPVFDLVMQRLAVDDLYMRSALFRSSLAGVREDPRVMHWFAASGHIDYWLTGGRWPDYCDDSNLSYECAEAARLAHSAPGKTRAQFFADSGSPERDPD
jgi:TolB-like protein/tetratricopeptide (TPR) repeat protein